MTNEELVEDVVEEVEEAVVIEPSGQLVHPLNYIADRRREYVVVVDEEEKKAWLMPRDDVPGDHEFRVADSILKGLPKPYDFKAEIKELLPSADDIRRAFWLKGIITQDDLADLANVKNALAIVLPSANAFSRFTGE